MARMTAAVMGLVLWATPALAEPVYVHAGRLVDVQEGRVLTDQRVTIEGERIVAVEPWTAPPAGSQVIDWSGMTVLPGLIDAHTHLADWGQSNNVAEPLLHTAEEIALIGADNARRTLNAGFTSVRDVGGYRVVARPLDVESATLRLQVLLADREEISWWEALGPRPTLVDVLSTLLALLELARRGQLIIRQSQPFTPPVIRRESALAAY